MENPNSKSIDCPILNIYLIGRRGTGCSSFLNRYIHNVFPYEDYSRLKPDFVKNIQGNKMLLIDNSYYKIRLWDSINNFRQDLSIPNCILKSPASILMLCDLTSNYFYEDIEYLIERLQRLSENEYYLCIVGSKNDLVDLRKIPSEEILEMTRKIGAGYMECSAKNGFGINECVLVAARALIDIVIEESNIKK